MNNYLFMKFCEKVLPTCLQLSQLRIPSLAYNIFKKSFHIRLFDYERYKTLIPKMSTVISSGQNDKIVEQALGNHGINVFA